MFVKKDERKIPQILSEASAQDRKENLTELRLARRPAEFNGSISILCQPHYANALHDLISLSLYDCQISTLTGIGYLASSSSCNTTTTEEEDENADLHEDVCCPHLKELNFGRNPLSVLSPELSRLSNSLTSLWLDDCEITGPLPECVYDLENLEILRISNNKITTLKGRHGIDKWKNMKVLCLDGNMIEEVPAELAALTHLESLLLRKNKLSALPEGVPGINHPNLTLLHVSSNNLRSLPSSISECGSLTVIYANANKITAVPEDMAMRLTRLESCNLCNNQIESVGVEFLERFGEPDLKSGKCEKDSACTVNLDQNPMVEKRRELLSQDDATMDTS